MILLDDLITNILVCFILGILGAILSKLLDWGKKLLDRNNDDKKPMEK